MSAPSTLSQVQADSLSPAGEVCVRWTRNLLTPVFTGLHVRVRMYSSTPARVAGFVGAQVCVQAGSPEYLLVQVGDGVCKTGG